MTNSTIVHMTLVQNLKTNPRKKETHQGHLVVQSGSSQAAGPAACPIVPVNSVNTEKDAKSVSPLSAQTLHIAQCQ